jgi:hypothetical protein
MQKNKKVTKKDTFCANCFLNLTRGFKNLGPLDFFFAKNHKLMVRAQVDPQER